MFVSVEEGVSVGTLIYHDQTVKKYTWYSVQKLMGNTEGEFEWV